MAGTRVWQCLDQHYSDRLKKDVSLIELECGLCVPCMIAAQMGAKVVLTDQPSLLLQLQQNIQDNFHIPYNLQNQHSHQKASNPYQIRAKPLSWSRYALQIHLTSLQNIHQFDFILNCDCVVEPLYGDSWKLLVEVIDELLPIHPQKY